MNNRFVDIYGKVQEGEKAFLLEFMFQLTIINRQFHCELAGDQLQLATKQLNEINHRVLNRVRDIGKSEPWCEKEYLLEMVPHHIGLTPIIEKGVNYAAAKAHAKLKA